MTAFMLLVVRVVLEISVQRGSLFVASSHTFRLQAQDAMSPLPAAALALCLLSFQVAAANDKRSCFPTRIDGVIPAGLSHQNSSAHSVLDCFLSFCGCGSRCVVSFNSRTGVCRNATLGRKLIKDVLSNSSAEDWVSFAPDEALEQPPVPPAAVLWKFDNSNRGRNLGSKGSRLDCPETGLTWSQEGPRGSRSPLKYANFEKNGHLRVQVAYDGISLIDRKKPVTFSLWVKSDRSGITPLFEGYTATSRAQMFWLYPSQNLDQIAYDDGRKQIYSVKNATDKLKWRNIAAVYKGGSDYAFYLNGNTWAAGSILPSSFSKLELDHFNIGYYDSKNRFIGSMACFSIFEGALTQQEIRTWMQSCP